MARHRLTTFARIVERKRRRTHVGRCGEIDPRRCAHRATGVGVVETWALGDRDIGRWAGHLDARPWLRGSSGISRTVESPALCRSRSLRTRELHSNAAELDAVTRKVSVRATYQV